jgi:hypothetical protein
MVGIYEICKGKGTGKSTTVPMVKWRYTVQLLLNLNINEVCGQLHILDILPPEKEPWYPLNRK